MKRALKVIVGLLAVFGLAKACTPATDTAEKVGDAAPTAPGAATTAAGQKTFAVGEQVALGDFQVVVYGVQNPMPPPTQFIRPKPGTHWVALDAEVTNRTAKPQSFSALLAFKMQDQANRTYSVNITSGATPGAPDGEMLPNGANRGYIVFEVPDDAGSLRLLFKSNLFGKGQAVIQVA